MNKTVNKFLLTGDKFMSELHLRPQGLIITLVERLLNIVKEFKTSDTQLT